MYKIDPNTGKQKFYTTDAAKSVLSAVISILIGMVVGTLIIVIVGLTRDGITTKGMFDGIKLVFFGLFSTGRDAGDLTFGFNPVNTVSYTHLVWKYYLHIVSGRVQDGM